MKELIIEFGNDTLGETRMYQRNPKGYEQAIKDMKLYKAQQKAKIDYLEAKLAESNASCILLEGLRNSEAEKKDIAMKRVSELKQQLEEKEEEIKKLTLLYFGDENTETILTTNKMIQHIKISFAVEQLEKVKELFESCWDYEFDIGELCNKGIFYNKIEQLIAELTHQHEDEGE